MGYEPHEEISEKGVQVNEGEVYVADTLKGTIKIWS